MDIILPEDQKIKEQVEEYSEDYIGHWYDGTFFINMTVSENFDNQETYQEMQTEKHNNLISKICFKAGPAFLVGGIGCLGYVIYQEKKKRLLEGKTPIILTFGGLCFLLYKLFEEIDLYTETIYWGKYSKGFLSTTTYYPQIYNFIFPTLLLLIGLIYWQKQNNNQKKSTKEIDFTIKIITLFIGIIGLSFITYRFGIRVYECIEILMKKQINIRIPFYYYMLDLPYHYAKTPLAYTKLVLLRFIKDLPVFISSTISIILFVKVLFSSLKGKIKSEINNKRYKIMMISLTISSILFNLIGLLEVKLYNTEFLYQYSEATYTIAIRSLTEPLLFVLFLYTFKYYTELAYKREEK